MALLALTGVAAVGGYYGVAAARDFTHHGAGGVALVHGDGRLPSKTAEDWVTYADHLLVATPTAETSSNPSDTDLSRGEGVTDRTLRMTVDHVAWSREGATEPPPAAFEWNAYGWTWHGKLNNRLELVDPDEPRFEVGHTYVMAVEWVPTHCTADGENIAGAWRGLGSGSELPYENGELGVGEVGGQQTDLATARESAHQVDDPNYGLKDEVVGKNVSALTDELNNAKEYPKTVDYGDAVSPCSVSQ